MWKTKQKVKKYVEEHQMIADGDRIVVGVSGGADSVCLFYLLRELQKTLDFQMVAVHVNHNLRGAEAGRDQEFVRKLCMLNGVSCRIISADVRKLAKEKKLSLEEAGRQVRYQAFERVCREENCKKIALAHHQDDLAETMLHHLARGTGLSGLCSLKPVSGNRIRPLLCLERETVEDYLRKRKISWQTDSTNLDDGYTRNKIRRHVVSYLCKEINPRTVAHMAQTAKELGEAEELIGQLVKEKAELLTERHRDGMWFREALKQEAALLQRRVFLEAMEELAGSGRDLTRTHGEEIFGLWEKQVGKCISLPYGLTAQREYEGIWLGTAQKENAEEPRDSAVSLKIPGITRVCGYEIDCRILPRNFNTIEEKKYTKWLDYDRIEHSLEFRHRRPGDRIVIHPSGGGKKLKDYLIDRKIPQSERDSLWLAADGNEILWVIGDRISGRYKVRETTQRVLYIQIKGGNIHE